MRPGQIVLLAALTGTLLGQTRISTAANQMSIELPTGFHRPSAEFLAKLHPNGKPVDLFRNPEVDGTLIFELASSQASAAFLPLVKLADEKDLAQDSRQMRWIARQVTTFQGKPCLYYEYVRKTDVGDTRYWAYYVLNGTNLLFFQLSIQDRYAGQYRNALAKTVASIHFAQ